MESQPQNPEFRNNPENPSKGGGGSVVGGGIREVYNWSTRKISM